MDLILWRHAQAYDGVGEFSVASDLARTLTPKGERQAQRMSRWLNQRLPERTHVLVSPAIRAQQTALALGCVFETSEALAPDASVGDLMQAAHWPDHDHTVVIVGHQPTLGNLAARLMTGQDLPWSIRKGAIWWFHCDEHDGALDVSLRAVQSPDML